jgi:hypothetical protein
MSATHTQTRTSATRLATTAVFATALTTAWIVVPTLRLLGLVSVLVAAVVAARAVGGRRAGEATLVAAPEPGGDGVSELAEQGMRDLDRYLERHAAFAAFLAQRDAGRPSPGCAAERVR